MLLSWQPYVQLTQNNLQFSKKRTDNAVKPISKPAIKIFCPYLCNRTSNRRKITSNVLKIESIIRLIQLQIQQIKDSASFWANIPPIDAK